MTEQTKPKAPRQQVNIELPDDIKAFLDQRKEALGASYKGTLVAAVRHYRDAIEASDAGHSEAREAAVAAFAKVITGAAVTAAKAKQATGTPAKRSRGTKAKAQGHDQPQA